MVPNVSTRMTLLNSGLQPGTGSDNQYPLSVRPLSIVDISFFNLPREQIPVQNQTIATRCLYSCGSSPGSSSESSPGSSSDSLPESDESGSESSDSDSLSDSLDLDDAIARHQEALLLQPGDHSDPAHDAD